MKFVVESACIADRFPILVSSPQSSLGRAAVRTDRSFAFCCRLKQTQIEKTFHKTVYANFEVHLMVYQCEWE